jgi:hypothetical protein
VLAEALPLAPLFAPLLAYLAHPSDVKEEEEEEAQD